MKKIMDKKLHSLNRNELIRELKILRERERSRLKYKNNRLTYISNAKRNNKKYKLKGRTAIMEGLISKEDAQILLDNNPSCQICGSTINLCIDHCHKDKVIRGILCRKCNSALGLLQEDKNILAKAITYMEEAHI